MNDVSTLRVVVFGLICLALGLGIRLWQVTENPCDLPGPVSIEQWEDRSAIVHVGRYVFRIDAETQQVEAVR